MRLCFTDGHHRNELTSAVAKSIFGSVQSESVRGRLELVFLNGCETHKQGASIIDAGVRWVVCWCTKVTDEAASSFAGAFFEELAKSADYRRAFDLAKLKLTREGTQSGGRYQKYALVDPKSTIRYGDLINAGTPLLLAADGQPLMPLRLSLLVATAAAAAAKEGSAEALKAQSNAAADIAQVAAQVQSSVLRGGSEDDQEDERGRVTTPECVTTPDYIHTPPDATDICTDDEVKYAVVGPEAVEVQAGGQATYFALSVWVMVDSQIKRFELEMKALREQGERQLLYDLDSIDITVAELIVHVEVMGCLVDKLPRRSSRTLQWNRKIRQSRHEIRVPPGFTDEVLRCEVTIEIPGQLRDAFHETFAIPVRCESSGSDATVLVAQQQVIHLKERVLRLEAQIQVPSDLLPAVVSIGVALQRSDPAVEGWLSSVQFVEGWLPEVHFEEAIIGDSSYAVVPCGTGWFFDARGLIFTCEHVRRACRKLLAHYVQGDHKLVVCPHIDGVLNWQEHSWDARVLAHTGHWDKSENDPQNLVPEPFDDVSILLYPKDAAVLWIRHHLATGELVSNPVRMPNSAQPITTLKLGSSTTLAGTEPLFALGFPAVGGRTATPSSGTYGGSFSDANGLWLKFQGFMSEGHSGGPVIAIQARLSPAAMEEDVIGGSHPCAPTGEVVGWNVRTAIKDNSSSGLNNARFIDDGLACIDAARQHAKLSEAAEAANEW